MSFTNGYNKLDAAFEAGEIVKSATLGDVFLPNEEMPDLSRPIGSKIEKDSQLTVASDAGEVAVAVTCRVVKPDLKLIEGVVPIEYFSAYVSSIPPTMTAKQIIEWSEEAGVHQSRMFTAFSKPSLERDDQDWQTYERQLKAWESINEGKSKGDRPDMPSSLMHKLVSEFPPTSENSHYEDTMSHFSVLREVAENLAPLGHLAAASLYGQDVVKKQTPEQFEAHVDWLLASED